MVEQRSQSAMTGVSKNEPPVNAPAWIFRLIAEFDAADQKARELATELREQHQIELSYSWVKQALQGAGLVARGRKRGVHRKRRARRPLPGMLLHIDGSRHRWFRTNAGTT